MFLKVPVIIIRRFAENNILGPKYIDIYKFGGLAGGGGNMVHHVFFVYYTQERKKYKSMTYTKIKFHIILI